MNSKSKHQGSRLAVNKCSIHYTPRSTAWKTDLFQRSESFTYKIIATHLIGLKLN